MDDSEYSEERFVRDAESRLILRKWEIKPVSFSVVLTDKRTAKCKMCGAEIQYVGIDGFPGFAPTVCNQCDKAIDQGEETARNAEHQRELQDKIDQLPYRQWDQKIGNVDLLNRIGGVVFQDKKPTGKSLYIHGSTGKCKTRAICEIARLCIIRGGDAVFKSAPRMMAEYAAEAAKGMLNGQSYVDQLVFNRGAVIIDDIGVGKRTERSDEFLYQLIDGRLIDKRPLWITSNMNPDALSAWLGQDYGPRIVRRLCDMCVQIKC